MLELGTDEFAKYPFLEGAGKILKDKGFSLSQFGTDPDLKSVVEKAVHRLKVSTKGGIYKSEITDGQASKSFVLEKEIFSFLLAIVLIKLTGMHTLIKRFALAEARRAENHLEKDLGKASDKSKVDLAIRIIYDLFNIEVTKENDFFTISVSDYLKHSIDFHEREWKLINRHVENGRVLLTPDKTVRLIRKELSTYIISKITNAPTPPMISGLENIVGELTLIGKDLTPSYTVTTGEHPPCIKHAIEILEKGENLPHSGRFMLATFLLSKGQSVQQIAPLFKNAPDYNERVTLYQLNHLDGTSGSGTQYSCPSCEKLKTQSLCFATSECDNIVNPLQFGRKKNNARG